MSVTKKEATSITERTWYQFLLITLTFILLLAALFQLIQGVNLLKKLDKSGVAEQLAQIINISHRIPNGLDLVKGLHTASIISITFASVIFFLLTMLLALHAEQTGEECNFKQSTKTAGAAFVASVIAVAFSVAAFVLYHTRLPLFEETGGVCEILYGFQECRSQLSNIRSFSLVPVLLLAFILPLSVFNVYAVRKYEKKENVKKARREARIEENRLYTLPVVDYGSNTATLK